MIAQDIFVGIDVSKLRLDVHLRHSMRTLAFDNSKPAKGAQVTAAAITHFGNRLEASGGYERRSRSGLALGGYTVHLLDRHKSELRTRMKIKAKTDPIDAA